RAENHWERVLTFQLHSHYPELGAVCPLTWSIEFRHICLSSPTSLFVWWHSYMLLIRYPHSQRVLLSPLVTMTLSNSDRYEHNGAYPLNIRYNTSSCVSSST